MIHALGAVSFLPDVGRSLREAFFMFWETLWALVLGFTLSGVVQAFVSKEQMQAKLGTNRPAAVGRAAGYGMVSSSCSYAASAMTKSLFAKGADFVAAMVFMVASTNLVIELGLVLLVLLGWQFMAAEFVGGPIMIILLALLGGFVFRSKVVAAARRRVAGEEHPGHDHVMADVSTERQEELEHASLSSKLRSPAAWSDAASYAVADLTMLRRELIIGFTVAGLLAVVVPTHVWNVLFLHGHGFWTSLENALVGPLIAVTSWVCSIGNVPLAAALWSGGISFGGVISFIFADLIAMPLILIYRKFYGWRLTLRIVGLFYALMATAGLLTEGIFRLVGAVPMNRSVTVSSPHFEWNYTAVLNMLFLGVAAVVWWLARNKARFGGGHGYAADPVCGMQVRISNAPAQAEVNRTVHYFCSDRCKERFVGEDGRVSASRTSLPTSFVTQASWPTATVRDPVCGMDVDPVTAPAWREWGGKRYFFCGPCCAESFAAGPDPHVQETVTRQRER